MRPWSYNFQPTHQRLIANLSAEYGECASAFVCGRDGIVALLYVELQTVLCFESLSQETVSIYRRHNHMYQVKGRIGDFDRKISRHSLSEIVAKYCDS